MPRSESPPLPGSFERADLEGAGFGGWRTWAELRGTDLREVPDGPGVYVVYRPSAGEPAFLDANRGGCFKGKNPTASTETLQGNWVPGARTLYIGKADRMRRRLSQYARFGAGEPVGHWGGRFIWQLADVDALLVAWHAISWDEAAREYERRLLAHFAGLHGGRRPFANLTD